MEANWGNPSQSDIETALCNSLVYFTARSESRIVGCIRIIGDGKLCFYIQDLIVAKSFRGKGAARKLLNAAFEYLEKHAAPNAYVGLMAAKGLEPFYRSYGFLDRPHQTAGAGMTLFWGRPKATAEQ